MIALVLSVVIPDQMDSKAIRKQQLPGWSDPGNLN